jgi:hypothetical protein
MNKNFAAYPAQKGVSLWDDETALADEGGYFVAAAVPGTPVAATICVDDAATASSTHAQFAPTALLYNAETASNASGVSLYPRYLRLRCTTAPASATAWYYSLRLDNVNRYSSGGTLFAAANVNPNSSQASKAVLHFGAIVPTALPSASSLLVGSGAFDSAIPVVGDQYTLHFGGSNVSNDMLSGGTTAKNVTMTAVPIVIPPGWCLAVDMWGPSNAVTPASWEFEFSWAERESGK